MADRVLRARAALREPLTAFIATVQDGRALQGVFLAMLALVVITVAIDLKDLVARGPDGPPGSQRIEPAPMTLPEPGDQTRPYLPRTMPLGPGRGRPDLPGYTGPLDQGVMAEPMQFLRGSRDRVTAIGRIDPGAASRLDEFLAANEKEIAEFVLHSPGGSVSDALAMSRAIRAAGISTRVPDDGYCASSCPLLLAGGLYRAAGETAFVGVHQIYAPEPATGSLQRGMADAQSITALAQRLLTDMGVDQRLWNHALVTPPADLYVFRPEELRRYNLANGRRPVSQPTRRPAES
ncbi:MAG: hypothetical protein AAFO79_05300 [Pseudomonadota bacterium]